MCLLSFFFVSCIDFYIKLKLKNQKSRQEIELIWQLLLLPYRHIFGIFADMITLHILKIYEQLEESKQNHEIEDGNYYLEDKIQTNNN